MAKVLVLHNDSYFRSQINLVLATNGHDVIGSDYTGETPPFPVDAAIVEAWCDPSGAWMATVRNIKRMSPSAKILVLSCCIKTEALANEIGCDDVIDLPHPPSEMVQKLESLLKK